MIDQRTGETLVRGRDGQRYTTEEVERIRARAKAGESDAVTRLHEIALPPARDSDVREQLRQLLDDCPECRAALARGEKPVMIDGHELAQARRSVARFKRPRWRTFKRAVGRR